MAHPITQARFRSGARISVWGRMATVVRQWRDDPTIVVFRDDAGGESLVITHFLDEDNPHVFEVPRG